MKIKLKDLLNPKIAYEVGELIGKLAEEREDEEEAKEIPITVFWVAAYTIFSHTDNIEVANNALKEILQLAYINGKEFQNRNLPKGEANEE